MSPAAKRPPAEPEEPREEWIGLHSLRPAPGSRRPRKRVGRGEGSGTGKTSGRGQKGYGSRSGAKDRARFEGGQMPIHMRMRKLRGPHKKQSMPFEPFRTHTQPVNLADLDARFEAGAVVTLDALRGAGLHPGRAGDRLGAGIEPDRVVGFVEDGRLRVVGDADGQRAARRGLAQARNGERGGAAGRDGDQDVVLVDAVPAHQGGGACHRVLGPFDGAHQSLAPAGHQ